MCAVPCARFLDFLIVGGLSAARWTVAGDLLPSRLAVEIEPLVVQQFATVLRVWEIPEDLQQKLSVGGDRKARSRFAEFLPVSQGRKTWSTITVTNIKSKLFGETELRN